MIGTLIETLADLDAEAIDLEEELHLAYVAGADIQEIARRRLVRLQERIYGPGPGSAEADSRTPGDDAATRASDAR